MTRAARNLIAGLILGLTALVAVVLVDRRVDELQRRIDALEDRHPESLVTIEGRGGVWTTNIITRDYR